MSNKDFEVKVTDLGGHYGSDAKQYEHPSYGMISIDRCSGKTELFGSDINHDQFFDIEIQNAYQNNHLGRSWYHGNKELIRVRISAAQFVEMIASMNTTGIPCTIVEHPEHGYIKYKKPVSQVDYASQYAKETASRASVLSKETVTRAKELLTAKGTMKVSEKEELLKLITKLEQDCSSNMVFAVNSAKEAIDNMKAHAVSEVDARLTHMITQTGLEVLKNPEMVEKLLENKKQK